MIATHSFTKALVPMSSVIGRKREKRKKGLQPFFLFSIYKQHQTTWERQKSTYGCCVVLLPVFLFHFILIFQLTYLFLLIHQGISCPHTLSWPVQNLAMNFHLIWVKQISNYTWWFVCVAGGGNSKTDAKPNCWLLFLCRLSHIRTLDKMLCMA